MKRRTLKTQCACWDGSDTIWIYSNEYNGLYRYSIEKEHIEYEASNPYEAINQIMMYNDALQYKDKLYLFPIYAEGIGIYDTKTKKFEQALIPTRTIGCYYCVMRIEDSKVLLNPVDGTSNAYILNMDDYEVETINTDKEKYKKIKDKVEHDNQESKDIEILKNKIKEENMDSRYIDICSKEGFIIAVPNKSEKVEIINNSKHIIIEHNEKTDFPFARVIKVNNSFYFMPYKARNMLIIESVSGEIKRLELDIEDSLRKIYLEKKEDILGQSENEERKYFMFSDWLRTVTSLE